MSILIYVYTQICKIPTQIKIRIGIRPENSVRAAIHVTFNYELLEHQLVIDSVAFSDVMFSPQLQQKGRCAKFLVPHDVHFLNS